MPHVTLSLGYEPPYDWPATLAFLAHRAIEGVERVESGVYARTIRCGGLQGMIEVGHDQARAALRVVVRGPAAAASDVIARRLRRAFDLDADVLAIARHLALDKSMAPLVQGRPALRVFGGWDGFEVAARTINGQQVTVERARRLNGVLVERSGAAMDLAPGVGLTMLFPSPDEVIRADLSGMGMPGARVTALKNVAAAAIAQPQLFDAAASLDDTIARLRAVVGIGEWTAHYIAMRACRESDAFPASDVGLLRGAADADGVRPTPSALMARAEPWRPWRAYAAHQLWAADSARAPGRP